MKTLEEAIEAIEQLKAAHEAEKAKILEKNKELIDREKKAKSEADKAREEAVQSSGRTFLRADVTTSGAINNVINSNISQPIRVTGGERLSVSMVLEALNFTGPPLAFWIVQVIFLDAALGNPAAPVPFQGGGNPSASVRQTAFIDVPATAVSFYFQVEGTFTLSSFESNTADIEILGVANGQLVTGRLALIKAFAPPNNSGGGGGGSGISVERVERSCPHLRGAGSRWHPHGSGQ